MEKYFQVIMVFSAVVLITTILLQQKGSGLSEAFGGGDSSYRTKRGTEKFLVWVTILMAITFFGTISLSLILSI